jgi:HD-GYP domain-containing protein (c-di-GMP phosphodiesterase class II)
MFEEAIRVRPSAPVRATLLALARQTAWHEEGQLVGHPQRTAALMRAVLRHWARARPLPPDAAWWPLAMLVHDVGKLRLPAELFRKPGPLSAAERALVETHTTLGAEECARLAAEAEDAEAARFWRLAEQVAGGHHERPDGQGYPQGLVGGAVPLLLRVARAVDVFDALTHHRAYHAARSPAEALAVMETEAGFDTTVLAVLRRVVAAGAGRPRRTGQQEEA